MKKILLSFVFAIALIPSAFAYQETETYTVYETLTIEKVTYPVHKETPNKVMNKQDNCKFISSIDVSKNKNCCESQEKPIKVKTHTEVIDHYQVYKPVTKYVPAGTYKTVRVIK